MLITIKPDVLLSYPKGVSCDDKTQPKGEAANQGRGQKSPGLTVRGFEDEDHRPDCTEQEVDDANNLTFNDGSEILVRLQIHGDATSDDEYCNSNADFCALSSSVPHVLSPDC